MCKRKTSGDKEVKSRPGRSARTETLRGDQEVLYRTAVPHLGSTLLYYRVPLCSSGSKKKNGKQKKNKKKLKKQYQKAPPKTRLPLAITVFSHQPPAFSWVTSEMSDVWGDPQRTGPPPSLPGIQYSVFWVGPAYSFPRGLARWDQPPRHRKTKEHPAGRKVL